MVTTDAIYAAYSDHRRDADALQTFIRNSAARSASRLRYLLLVGGDTPDYFDVRGAQALTLVPTRYAKVGDLMHFAPTDVPYGDLDADGLPDIPTGRLIVRTIPELEAVVAKLNAYSGARAGLFVTGRSDTGNGFAEQHEAMSQVLADTGWDLADLAVDDYFDNGLETADARLDLIDQLQLGYPLVSYLGHSDYDYWDFGPLFRRTDIASLATGHPPFGGHPMGLLEQLFRRHHHRHHGPWSVADRGQGRGVLDRDVFPDQPDGARCDWAALLRGPVAGPDRPG